MKIHERIRMARHAKDWTQEEMAHKLGMSVNGYGNLERGDCDLKLSRLTEIASLLGLSLIDLFAPTPDDESSTDNTFSRWCSSAISTACPYLKVEKEKQQLLQQLKDKELELKNLQIQYLTELTELFKNS